MKPYAVMSVLILGYAWAPGQTSSSVDSNATPQVGFESTTFDFGRVKSGESVKHDFIFTNAGTAMLKILDVKTGCGCTTAGAWDKQVEPGKTGRIPLQFLSAGYSGQFAKTTTVTCNDPDRTNVLLQIIGTVWKPIDVTPTMAMFSYSSEEQTNQTKVLRIVSNLEEAVTLSDLQCSNTAFRAELKTVKPGKEFELSVTTLPPFASQTVFTPITLKTSAAEMPKINVTAYAVVQAPVAATPQQIMIPVGPLTNAFTSTITVRNSSTNSVALSEPKLDAPGADVSIQEKQSGRLFTLSVTFQAGFQLPPAQRAELTVKTSHPKYPLLKVPVFHMQARPAPAVTAAPAPSQIGLKTASPVKRVVPTRSPAPDSTSPQTASSGH